MPSLLAATGNSLLFGLIVFALNGVLLYNRAIFQDEGFDKFSETIIVHHGRVYGQINYLKPVGYIGMRDCTLEIVYGNMKGCH